MKKIKVIIVSTIFILIAVLVFIIATNNGTKKYNDSAVIQQIKSLNRWETSAYTVEQIIDSGQSGNVFEQILFGNRILLIAHGTSVGGFDLSGLGNNDVKINNDSITVNLPAPQILSTSLDETQTRVYDRQKGLLVPSTDNLESDARASAVEKIRVAACSGGILNQAQDNAKKELSSILKSLGFTYITINIPQGRC